MKIVFTGNRQCEFVATALRSLVAHLPDVTVFFIRDDGSLPARSAEILQSADHLILQERDADRNFDPDELNRTAHRHHLPAISTDFVWPFGGMPHIFNRAVARFDHGPFPASLGDAWLNRHIQQHSSSQVWQDYPALPLDQVIDLAACRDAVLDRQHRIDLAAGTHWASLIECEAAVRPFMRNPLHPAPWVLQDMLGPLIAAIGLDVNMIGAAWVQVGTTTPELPVHPAVAHHFKLAWAADARHYRLRPRDSVTFTDYVRRYCAFAEGPELEIGLAAAAGADHQDAIDNLGVAVARPIGYGVADAQLGLANALMTSGRIDDAAAAFGAYFAVGGTQAAAAIALADIHAGRGRHDVSADVLRAALATAGPDRALQSRLTRSLAACGDLHEACRSAQAETMLDPANPHARAYLALLQIQLGDLAAARLEVDAVLQMIGDRPDLNDLRETMIAQLRRCTAPMSFDHV